MITHDRIAAIQVEKTQAAIKEVFPEAKDVQQLLRTDPDYFFTMAPYALMFGVSKHFARVFGNRRFSACHYLTTGMDGHRTAGEWYALVNLTLDAMYQRERRLPVEKLMNFLYRFTK